METTMIRANTRRGIYNKRDEDGNLKIQSWAKLKIRDEDGWDDEMRHKYFNLNTASKRIISDNDFTDLGKRAVAGYDRKTNAKKGGANNHADGIWSLNKMKGVRSVSDDLIRFIIMEEKKRRDAGETSIREIQGLAHINHHHVTTFLKWKKDNGCTNSTLSRYLGDLKKWRECTVKVGINSHISNLIKPKIHKGIVGEKKKEDFVRNMGETDGKRGYTLEQAEQIIANLEDKQQAQVASAVLTYVGLREETLFSVTWGMVLDFKGKVNPFFELLEDGLMKNNRHQLAMVLQTEKYLQKLWNSGEFRRTDKIFGDDFSEHTLKNALSEAAAKSGIDWKGYHAFRPAAMENLDTRIIPEMSREEVVDNLLKLADIILKDKHGNKYKPHNPLIPLMKPKFIPKTDSNGNVVYKKDGSPVMKVYREERTGKNGKKYWVTPKYKVLGNDGKPVIVPKYDREELMHRNINWLRNSLASEQMSHNRSDANGPYRFLNRKKQY
ncbi:hypothetical protein HPT25_01680 [Bacillus sp. BRMEA1]|uniref:hypothetical protein n=1 Tax=Neobacillus endophyticus TaxID=2738405 RepID=UPI001565AB97|nr:hypothetical protein [Neobacillus endophyticus]NRD76218.1 hypothetical protein [Neobacillus endophyticus]